MNIANPLLRHKIRLDARVTRCGATPPPRGSEDPEGLPECPECYPQEKAPSARGRIRRSP